MPWCLFKDAGAFIFGIAGLYLVCFGTLSRGENDNDPQLARVWLTYIALAVATISAIVWLVTRVFHR